MSLKASGAPNLIAASSEIISVLGLVFEVFIEEKADDQEEKEDSSDQPHPKFFCCFQIFIVLVIDDHELQFGRVTDLHFRQHRFFSLNIRMNHAQYVCPRQLIEFIVSTITWDEFRDVEHTSGDVWHRL